MTEDRAALVGRLRALEADLNKSAITLGEIGLRGACIEARNELHDIAAALAMQPPVASDADAEAAHAAEDGEALHMNLDREGVPRADESGAVFSLWGRVCYCLAMQPPGDDAVPTNWDAPNVTISDAETLIRWCTAMARTNANDRGMYDRTATILQRYMSDQQRNASVAIADHAAQLAAKNADAERAAAAGIDATIAMLKPAIEAAEQRAEAAERDLAAMTDAFNIACDDLDAARKRAEAAMGLLQEWRDWQDPRNYSQDLGERIDTFLAGGAAEVKS